MRIFNVTAVLPLAIGFAAVPLAQPYPNRPLTLIAPSSPGGPVDITARTIAPTLAKILAQPVVVENRPGASQKIGMQSLLRAPRDGYTFSVVSAASMTINPLIDPAVGYDPLKDFTLFTSAVESYSVMVVHPSVPVKSLREFITLARANPSQLSFGDGGRGTRIHFTTRDLLMRLGLQAVHVPYKGDPPALTDLIAGQIQFMLPVAGVAKPFIDNGRLRALAMDGDTRWKALPHVPAIPELGISELKGPLYRGWLGYAAAAGLPQDVSAKLHAAIMAALQTPEVKAGFETWGFQIVGTSPQVFAAALRAEIERNRQVIAAGGFPRE